MTDPDDESAMWPGSPYALADTRLCPACFQRLTATTCGSCGLVLHDPRALQVLEIGRGIVELEDQRQHLIGEIRLAHRPAPVPVAVEPSLAPAAGIEAPFVPGPALSALPAEAVSIPVPSAAAGAEYLAFAAPAAASDLVATPDLVATHPAPPTAAPPTTISAPPAEPPAPRRRLTVPVLLLIVGVSLVGIAAIFFLVVAWNIDDIRTRALIIGGVTLATLIAASLLRRFSLTATAEGIGALGVILLGLDAWAVRANDLFGAGAMDAVVYAAVAILTLGILCRLWSVLSRLRGPDVAATLALPVGLGLLVAGLLPLPTVDVIVAGFLGTAVGGLAQALPAPWSAARSRPDSIPERTTLAAIGVAALVGAGATLFVGLESMAVQLVAAALVVVLGAAYVVTLQPRTGRDPLPASKVLAVVAGAAAATIAASFGWQSAIQSELPVFAALITPVVAVGVAVALDRWHPPRFALAFTAARIAAAVVAAVCLILLLASSVARGAVSITTGWMLWDTPVFASPIPAALDIAILEVIATLVVAILLFFAPTLRAGLREARPVAAAIIILAGALGTGIPIVIAGVATLLAATALTALAREPRSAGWGAAAGIGAVSVFLAGLAAPWLWAIGVVVAIAVPIVARIVARPKEVGAVVLALAPVVVAVVAAAIAPAALGAALGVEVDVRAAFVLLQWVALVALAAAVLLRIDATSRSAVAVSAYAPLVLSLLMFIGGPVAEGSVSAVLVEPALAIARCALLVAVLAAVALRRTRIDAETERGAAALGAALLVAPVAASAAIVVLETVGVVATGWMAFTVACAAAVTVWLGALTPARAYGASASQDAIETDAAPAADSEAPAVIRHPYPTLARRAADIGALATALVVVIPGFVPDELWWPILAVVAAGFAAASVTRGWAGARTSQQTGIIETRADGVVLALAPRRLFAWVAFAAASLAWGVWLAGFGDHQIEMFVVPPAAGLLVFAAVLVWLRRHVEATIAVIAGLTLGLVVPATVSLAGAPPFAADPGDSLVRGIVVAVVATAATLILAWTSLRRVRMPALAGATVSVVALAIFAIGRAVGIPAITAWLVLLVAVAYASAIGFIRRQPAARGFAGADPLSLRAEARYAGLLPPIVLAAASLATLPSLDDLLVVGITFAATAILHLLAAALHRLPFTQATRWTAFGAAALAGVGAVAWADVDAVELVSLPLAALLLGGAALAMWRRDRAGLAWPGGERVAWLAGLVLAVAPSVVAVPNDPRTWLVIAGALLAAIGCVVAPIADATGLKAPSALLLAAGALAMGFRALFAPSVASGEYAALAAGAGALAVAAAMVWMREAEAAPSLTTVLAGAGATLILADVVLQSHGELVQTTLTATIAGVIGVGGAALLRWRAWEGIGAVIAVAGLIAALVAVGRRFLLVSSLDDAGIEPDLWAVVGVGILVAIGIMAIRSTRSPGVAIAVGVTFSLALVLFTLAELQMLAYADGDEVRTVLTMTALTAAGIIGWVWRARLGAVFAPTAAVLAAIFGLAALTMFAVRPVELVTIPAALGMILLGARALHRNPALRTWPALGTGLALLLIPSLLHDFGTTTLWRVVALGVVGIGLVVAGVIWRLQAPLVLGSVVVLVHAVAQLWPWVSSTYVLPLWVWLGIGGAVLIFLAARYEKNMRAFRTAFIAVTSLR